MLAQQIIKGFFIQKILVFIKPKKQKMLAQIIKEFFRRKHYFFLN